MEPVGKTSEAIIAGVDEVGRGAFAGPLIAGCVVFSGPAFAKASAGKQKDTNRRILSIKINDSKKLTAKQREQSAKWIKENALAWGIGNASVAYINKHGLTRATHKAFRASLRQVQKKVGKGIDILMLDAFYVPHMKGIPREKQFAIVKGDSKSISVAAASIIAKVHRDALMTRLSKNPRYKKYQWDKNKGYGTKDHRHAIKKYGATRKHRLLWLKEKD